MVLFHHHNLTDKDTYDAYERRCNRFLKDISTEECCLVYMNDILDDTNDIIQFYHNIIENKINLYMVGLVKGYENKLLHKFQNYIFILITIQIM